MLSASEYGSLVSLLVQAGARPVISAEDYLASHHLPNWYSLIFDLTPETRVFPSDCDLETELRALAWPEYFIKDYVKSLKTSVGSRISKTEQVSAVVADMQRFRGVIEGGFCVRRVESFLPDTERRYFVLDGVAHAASGLVPETPLILESRMAENGVIFSDGIEKDFLEFNSGTQAVIGIAKRKGVLVE